MTYAELPPECLLRILSFLSLSDIAALLRTSRHWYSVITGNESVVYRTLAVDCESMDVPVGSLNDALKGWASPAAVTIQNWKQYCRLQVMTRQRWRGEGTPYMSFDVFRSVQEIEVHKIKLDTAKALLVMTGQSQTGNGSVIVHCLRNPGRRALFHLKQVVPSAHLEVSAGFIVFKNNSGVLEIWRWAQDQLADPLDCKPSEQQQTAYVDALNTAGFQLGSSHRGELLPVDVLDHPADSFVAAFRLVYPTLCAGIGSSTLWLWNVRTRNLLQTINISSPEDQAPFGILYVDVNETHAFVATRVVSVYSRTTGQCVFRLRESHHALLATCVDLPSIFEPSQATFQYSELPQYHSPDLRIVPFHHSQDAIMAVHVSPTGDDFVAISHRGLILFISGLKSEDEIASSERFRISAVHAQSSLSYLAYDGHRILAYGAQGLSYVNVQQLSKRTFGLPADDNQGLRLYPFPAKYICRLNPFGDEDADYADCNCLQVTQDGFWVTWIPSIHPIRRSMWRYHERTVGMVDFARSSH